MTPLSLSHPMTNLSANFVSSTFKKYPETNDFLPSPLPIHHHLSPGLFQKPYKLNPCFHSLPLYIFNSGRKGPFKIEARPCYLLIKIFQGYPTLLGIKPKVCIWSGSFITSQNSSPTTLPLVHLLQPCWPPCFSLNTSGIFHRVFAHALVRPSTGWLPRLQIFMQILPFIETYFGYSI